MRKKDIAYQNKDIISKVLAENFKEKSLNVYGLDVPKIKGVLPTSLPAVQVNELRIDNLFLLADGSIAVIDYESSVKWENYLKYMNYIVRILKRYKKKRPRQIRMIVIYTADVEKAPEEFAAGCITLRMERAFLRGVNSEEVFNRLESKVEGNAPLTDEELMEFIILPLTYRGKEGKRQAVRKTVELAKKIGDGEKQTFVLAGLLAFADKVIDQGTAKYVKEVLRMTQVAKLLWEEGREEGLEEGKKEGLEEGKKEGLKEGLKEGISLTGRVYQKIKANPTRTDRQIAKAVGCTVADVKEIRKIFGK